MILEIVTRTTRNRDVGRNLDSVSEVVKLLAENNSPLTIEQTVLVDHYLRGIALSHTQMLARITPRGDYVFILDDDDVAIPGPDWIDLGETLKSANEATVSVRMIHRGTAADHYSVPVVLPKSPGDNYHGSRGISSVVVPRATFNFAKIRFGEHYDGDQPYIHSVLRGTIIQTNFTLSKEMAR